MKNAQLNQMSTITENDVRMPVAENVVRMSYDTCQRIMMPRELFVKYSVRCDELQFMFLTGFDI